MFLLFRNVKLYLFVSGGEAHFYSSSEPTTFQLSKSRRRVETRLRTALAKAEAGDTTLSTSAIATSRGRGAGRKGAMGNQAAGKQRPVAPCSYFNVRARSYRVLPRAGAATFGGDGTARGHIDSCAELPPAPSLSYRTNNVQERLLLFLVVHWYSAPQFPPYGRRVI